MINATPVVELDVAVHVDKRENDARFLSLDGEAKNAKWIPRSLTQDFALTGKQTSGTDWRGQRCILPMAKLTLPEWKARQEGFV